MQPGDSVRIKANPSRVGILTNERSGPARRPRCLVDFSGEQEWVLVNTLEKVQTKRVGPYELIQDGNFGGVSHLRGSITYQRLSGRLANLIYSLNVTNTKFFAYQFKPVLQYLDSPSNSLLIADEVGLGKTIEAGLIWTELKARQEARRLLVVCPAMLREKWRDELLYRFGVSAEIVDAQELHSRIVNVKNNPYESFALIASMQGLRPPSKWDNLESPSQTASALLARFLDENAGQESFFDLVIIDEAHYLRNRETKTHQLGRLLRATAEGMVMLSATPIQLRSSDLYHLLHLLDEDAFHYEGAFDNLLRVNAPVVNLRDRILAGVVTQQQFIETLAEIQHESLYVENEQIHYFLENPPSDKRLTSAEGRSEIADQLDRLNPLTKIVTRTLKRDVHENRVVRKPVVINVTMTDKERAFYDLVTQKVRNYCAKISISEGFLLTIPQRQLSSSMAAACRSWQERFDSESQIKEDEELLYEIGVDDNKEIDPRVLLKKDENRGMLLQELSSIAHTVTDLDDLIKNDSKYNELLNNLINYWEKNPEKKIVLFSFYKNTLHYLSQRLAGDGITSLVLHGGMDKYSILKEFESESGANILLSSEVASEGVDLQFSSVLINYDLPWNPAKIEQRIGRIDRIGQEEPQIFIWNFFYENSIDERIYNRLLERLKVFESALGSMEMLLGDVIKSLSFELLSHELTPEQEQEKIDRAMVTLEKNKRDQNLLELEATNLIAHGDFIQSKVTAAQELGRYIQGEDIFVYIQDFLKEKYPGSRILADLANDDLYTLELSGEARVDFDNFLKNNYLEGKTHLLTTHPPKLRFKNNINNNDLTIETVTQEHPLTRFITNCHRLNSDKEIYHPVVAAQVNLEKAGINKGIYVYAVARWWVAGARDTERLEYCAYDITKNEFITNDMAETIVNATALTGQDWLDGKWEVSTQEVADLQDECRAELEEGFYLFRDATHREDMDRANMMISTLEQQLSREKAKILDTIKKIQDYGDERSMRIIPAQKGRIKKLEMSISLRISEIKARLKSGAEDNLVSSGIIKVV